MKKRRLTLIIAGAVATLVLASHASAQPTDAEFDCEKAVAKAGAKFVVAKAKCIGKCLKFFWNGPYPSSDCLPPYGGATARCINDTVFGKNGAENKFSAAILKACDPATKDGADCPECYNGGDCSSLGYASDQVQNVEGQVDSFVPGIACELDSADIGEQKCQINTAKVLAKEAKSVGKCYDKCLASARKGLIDDATCAYPASDPTAAACITKATGKAIASVDKRCSAAGAIPDCGSPDDYPTGAMWANLVHIAVGGIQSAVYCE